MFTCGQSAGEFNFMESGENLGKPRSYELAAELEGMLNTLGESPAVKVQRKLLNLTPEQEKEITEDGNMEILRKALDNHPDVKLFQALLSAKGIFKE